jgi:predicted peroxiredoxin
MTKILYLGTSGSDNPTRAGLPFNFAMGALDAGHQPEIFLAGEAVYLMKSVIADSVMPIAMAPLKEMLDEVLAQRVPIFVWGKCSVARGVTEDDLKGKNAQFANPKLLAEKVVAADKVVSV